MKICKTLIAGVLLAGSVSAQAEISGNVSLTSDYAFRGVSQTDEQIAIQGGLDYAHESGGYVGVWASNVDSSFFNDGTDPQTEIDLYAGYGFEANGIGYDFGWLHYDYPGCSDCDTDELYASVSYMDFTVSINYSDELSFLGVDESGYYLAGGYEYALPQDFGLSLHLGYSDGDAFDDLGDSYMDWSVGVSKSVAGVDLGLTYVDTDSNGEDLFGDLADSRIVFSVGKSM